MGRKPSVRLPPLSSRYVFLSLFSYRLDRKDMKIQFENPGAFAPMTEPVKWTQDKAPHRVGVFGAIVTQGAAQSQSAGDTLAPLTADVWTVHVSNATALVADVAVGDTLSRVGIGAEVLTVQKITRSESGWWLSCTANERSPI